MALTRNHPVSPPAWNDPIRDRQKAETFGAICVNEIRRCQEAMYRHHGPTYRRKHLQRDQEIAVAMARIAWRAASALTPGEVRLALQQRQQAPPERSWSPVTHLLALHLLELEAQRDVREAQHV